MLPEKIKNSLLLNVLLFLLALAAGYGAFNMVKQAAVLKKEEEDARKKIEELAKKRKELESALLELQSPEAIEREAKERFNLKRSSEEVVVVVPEKKGAPASTTPSAFWEKIKSLFKRQ